MTKDARSIYDFDGTIYRGDSTVDFFRFCVRREPRVLADLLCAAPYYGGMALGVVEKTRAKERFYRFLTRIPDVDAMLTAFWDEHIGCVYPWYLAQRSDDDVIVSASPAFLLRPACARLHVNLLASRVDAYTGATDGLNCHGEEKVRRLFLEYSTCRIDRFYSDTRSDAPLARMARKAYLVRRGRVMPFPPEWLRGESCEDGR